MIEEKSSLVRTARITGIWYLLLAISGVLGFIVYHPQVYVLDDPAKTLTNLSAHESVARIRLLLEFIIVLSQALAAVWFYRLFRNINEWGAWALGIWGTVNAVIILISAIAMAAGIDMANSTDLSVSDKTIAIKLLMSIISNVWGIGSLFFGFWLLPMAWIILKSGRMPQWLGIILLLGGVGYVLSAFLGYAGLKHTIIGMLPLPATVGEFWIIGYLLIYGIRMKDES